MTKIKDVFEEIFVGINLSTCSNKEEKQEVYTFKKENINYNTIFYTDFGLNRFRDVEHYSHLTSVDLLKIKVPKNVKEKYFLKSNDIIISLKKPYKTFSDVLKENDKIIVTNNYIVLRNYDYKKYYVPYLTYYIENMCCKGFLNKKYTNELSLEDVKNIEVPDISLAEQTQKALEITALHKNIIKAQNHIQSILDNDCIKNNQN